MSSSVARKRRDRETELEQVGAPCVGELERDDRMSPLFERRRVRECSTQGAEREQQPLRAQAGRYRRDHIPAGLGPIRGQGDAGSRFERDEGHRHED